ncbi:hypothetical protein ABH926_008107 [Catenulispora sp. GP43]|uniref:chaplin n=1 Tax=Catenulispora sp. GP43 TaxID=3156263 RepID=UPI0035193239
MHAFARKGLLLSAATGTLVMGYAGIAAAQDSATTHGAAADSPGAVSGNVAQVPADVPIQVCGDAGAAAAGMVGSRDNDCLTDDATAKADGVAADSPGAVSGNVGSVAANVPVQACGLSGGALAADVQAHDNDCVDEGTHALAKGAAADSPGLVSGNVLQLSADAPVQACGDAVSLLGFDTAAKDNHCVNGAPEMAPPVMARPPVMTPPPSECPQPPPVMAPPPVNPCPPPPPGQCPPPGSDTWSPSASETAPPSDAAATPQSSEIPAPPADTAAPAIPAPPAS